MREIDSHFDAYEHLSTLPREEEALHMLRKAASVVKPMMRKRGWKVGTLAEFLPDEPQLLGSYRTSFCQASPLTKDRSEYQQN
jgi:predicted metallo-beta-lactamase superfamily hydrolase